ncbi:MULTISPECIES: chemotaxis protein CheD [Giesbergeria]
MAHLNDLIDIFLKPGEYFVGDANYQIRTMLGSCVSITLWHPASRLGAMSHFLLPTRHLIDTGVHTLDARYGDEALQLMLAELAQAGINPQHCQSKIFGGGNMFPKQTRRGLMHIGRKNGEAARTLLQAHGIPIVSESLFGIGHRQIIFDVSTGDVWSHQVKPSLPPHPP